jgi:hypothetical protein
MQLKKKSTVADRTFDKNAKLVCFLNLRLF